MNSFSREHRFFFRINITSKFISIVFASYGKNFVGLYTFFFINCLRLPETDFPVVVALSIITSGTRNTCPLFITLSKDTNDLMSEKPISNMYEDIQSMLCCKYKILLRCRFKWISLRCEYNEADFHDGPKEVSKIWQTFTYIWNVRKLALMSN